MSQRSAIREIELSSKVKVVSSRARRSVHEFQEGEHRVRSGDARERAGRPEVGFCLSEQVREGQPPRFTQTLDRVRTMCGTSSLHVCGHHWRKRSVFDYVGHGHSLLECADATRREPVAREGVKHVHSAVAVLSLCESVKCLIF